MTLIGSQHYKGSREDREGHWFHFKIQQPDWQLPTVVGPVRFSKQIRFSAIYRATLVVFGLGRFEPTFDI